MAISNLPTFTDEELLAAGKLNQMRNAISSKFSAITGADLTWPLVAQGNIDFGSQYGIVGLRTFWNIINAAEYETLQDAVDAAEAAGGGCVLIPPDTTITADSVEIEASGISIVGCGASSVLQLTLDASTGYLLQTGTGSLSGIMLANLTMDGNGATGNGQAAFIAQRVDRLTIMNVYFNDFSGYPIHITNDGTPGNASSNVEIINVSCNACDSDHLFSDDVDGLTVVGLRSTAAGGMAVNIEAADAAAYVRDISLVGVRATDPTTDGISILGAAATVSTNQTGVHIDACWVRDAGSDGFVIGDASKLLQHVYMSACKSLGATGDAFRVNTDEGTLSGLIGPGAGGDGLDLVASLDVDVKDGNFKSATTYGVDAEGTTRCSVTNCNVLGAGTEGVRKDTATDLYLANNAGDGGPAARSAGWWDGTTAQVTSASETELFAFTLPANTIARSGQGLRIFVTFSHNADDNSTFRLKIDGTTVATSDAVASADSGSMIFWIVADGVGTQLTTKWAADESNGTVSVTQSNQTFDFTTDLVISVTGQGSSGTSTSIFDGILIEPVDYVVL